MRRDILKRFIKWHWKKVILIVILLISSYEAYADFARAEERMKEAEEIIIMDWFGPRIRYEMIQEWNKNGIRGWGMWDETICDEIEKAIEADELGEEEKQVVLKLLNGGVKFDICAMDIGEFQSAVLLMEQIAGREGIRNERGRQIEEGEISVMWSNVNGRAKMRQGWNVKRVQRHWKLIVFAVILFVSLCMVYTDHVKTEKGRRETEEDVTMGWFGPKVHYDIIQKWNKEGVRGWGTWDEETCNLIEQAIKTADLPEDHVWDEWAVQEGGDGVKFRRKVCLALLNGSSKTGMEVDICSMDIRQFVRGVQTIERIASREKIKDEYGIIEEGSITAMWNLANGGRPQ